jgi:hypothetical protein
LVQKEIACGAKPKENWSGFQKELLGDLRKSLEVYPWGISFGPAALEILRKSFRASSAVAAGRKYMPEFFLVRAVQWPPAGYWGRSKTKRKLTISKKIARAGVGRKPKKSKNVKIFLCLLARCRSCHS